jgi:glutathione synthase/RimK-type ligase-like ATP-grasp enzyme
LSEVAYQLADTNSGDRTVIAKDIVKLNADVATAFGVFLSGVDIISTIPSNEESCSLWQPLEHQ